MSESFSIIQELFGNVNDNQLIPFTFKPFLCTFRKGPTAIRLSSSGGLWYNICAG